MPSKTVKKHADAVGLMVVRLPAPPLNVMSIKVGFAMCEVAASRLGAQLTVRKPLVVAHSAVQIRLGIAQVASQMIISLIRANPLQ